MSVPEFKPFCKCPAPRPCLDPRKRGQVMVFKDAAKYYSHIKARHADLLFNHMDLDGKFPEFKLAGSVLGFHGSSYKFTITEVSHFFTEVWPFYKINIVN